MGTIITLRCRHFFACSLVTFNFYILNLFLVNWYGDFQIITGQPFLYKHLKN